jgi:hypothetical protein
MNTRKPNIDGLAATILLSLGLCSTALAQDDFDLDWWTLDGGGAVFTTGGDFELSGTIGQPDAGDVMTGGAFELTGGFWAGRVPGPGIPGDCDGDGDVDLDDYALFAGCLSGPQGGITADCGCFDDDRDLDVDLLDFVAFQLAFTG